MVFNKAARIITSGACRERITPTLIDLHWMPIKAKIVFKICTMVYTALRTEKPDFLRQKLEKFKTCYVPKHRDKTDEFKL